MTQLLIAYVTTAVVFLAVDAVWLSRIAKPFYFGRLGHLLRDRPKMGAAAAFYAVYVVGIVFFAISPALASQSAATALLNGGLFGFFAYATYDMTNYATIRGWPFLVVVVDVVWGTVLTGGSALCGYVLTSALIAP